MTVAVLALAVPAFMPAARGGPDPTLIDREDAQDCSEWTPAAVATPIDESKELTLEVYVLLDGISIDRGKQIMETVARAYTPLNIKIVPAFEQVTFKPDTTDPPPFGSGDPAHSRDLMQVAKDHLSGARPWGSDVVYTMSATPIAGGVAGVAYCIGGVRYATRAFAIGEAVEDPSEESGWFNTNTTAKIAAHEIAHLLGAHHHYANCAEGDKGAIVPEMALCTVMINDVGLVSLQFSTLERSVVRGHVAAFAADTPTGPEPAHERSISLSVKGKPVARGTVRSSHYACIADVTVEIEIKQRDGWARVATTEAKPNGTYEAPIDKRFGTYRAVVARSYFAGKQAREACAEAISPVARRG